MLFRVFFPKRKKNKTPYPYGVRVCFYYFFLYFSGCFKYTLKHPKTPKHPRGFYG